MTQASSSVRTSTAALLAILALSAVTMLWLFWHFPKITAMVTFAVLAALWISARLSGSTDTDVSELERS